MSEQSDWIERARAVFAPNYRPAPVVLERGEGVYVYDRAGRRYLDLVSGIAVSALGHNHPRLVEALARQAGRLLHTSNLYWNRPAIELAERLVEVSFGDRVFLCNSGTEANEAAIKLARRAAFARGQPERTGIIAFHRSFHGRTYGALAATGQPKYWEGFGPMLEGFTHLELGEVDALENAIDERTAAVIVEPIQGEGGVYPAPQGFLSRIRELCDRHGALMIVDEVQAGVGRTGRMFAYEHSDVRPDIMAVAKGVGGGVPLGAVVATQPVAEALIPGTHGSTYGGNPLACVAGCVVIDEVRTDPFLDNVRVVGDQLRAGLTEIGRRTGAFDDVRGAGLMIGASVSPQMPFAAKDIVDVARDHGLLVHVAGPQTLRMVPPLVLRPLQATEGLERLENTIHNLLERPPKPHDV